MPRTVLISTFGFDEQKVLRALRWIPYDRLALLAGDKSLKEPGFRRLEAAEYASGGALELLTVDPFDFRSCFEGALGGIRRHRKAGDEVRMAPGERLGDGGADVVGHDGETREPELGRERSDVLRDGRAVVAVLGGEVGLLRVREAAEVGHDHVVVLGQGGDHRRPLVPEPRPAVEQDHGESPSLADVVEPDAATLAEVVGPRPLGTAARARRLLFQSR